MVAFAALAWVTHQSLSELRQQSGQELAQRDARFNAHQLGARLQNSFGQLAMVAQDQRLAEACTAADTERLAVLQASYQRQLPDSLRLMFLPAGLNTPDLEAEPPLGYAVIEMLRAAEREGKAPAPEVHLAGQPSAHVNLVQPIQGAEGVIGHVLVSYPRSEEHTSELQSRGHLVCRLLL